MKFSIDESLKIIEMRSAVVRRKRDRRKAFGLEVASLGLLVLLVASIARFGEKHCGDMTADAFGASFVPAETGGLVLVGVICFVTAVIVTAYCVQNRGRRER